MWPKSAYGALRHIEMIMKEARLRRRHNMDDKRLDEIRVEWEAATHGLWRSCIGSGNHVMTGIVADAGGSVLVIADMLPDWALDEQAAPKDHRPNMTFIENAHNKHIPYLLALVESQRAEIEAQAQALEAEHKRVKRLAEALEDVRVHGLERSWSHTDYGEYANDVLMEVYASYAPIEEQTP